MNKFFASVSAIALVAALSLSAPAFATGGGVGGPSASASGIGIGSATSSNTNINALSATGGAGGGGGAGGAGGSGTGVGIGGSSSATGGTISNRDRAAGSACIAERRAIELGEHGEAKTGFMRFGDRVRMEMRGLDGSPLFGVIEQRVERYDPQSAKADA